MSERGEEAEGDTAGTIRRAGEAPSPGVSSEARIEDTHLPPSMAQSRPLKVGCGQEMVKLPTHRPDFSSRNTGGDLDRCCCQRWPRCPPPSGIADHVTF